VSPVPASSSASSASQSFDERRWRVAPLTLADCDELARVHVAVWREAYAGLMDAAYLRGLREERFAERWRSRASASVGTSPASVTSVTSSPASSPGGADAGGPVTLVARDRAGVVGFVSAGSSRDEDPPTAWELWAINLLGRARGTGLAEHLVQLTVGDRDASLWVVEGNARARSFYTRLGFAPDGARSEHEPTGAPEVRLVRRRA
jgi:ribosomal protein S18 acetylase RimI-like enzyme